MPLVIHPLKRWNLSPQIFVDFSITLVSPKFQGDILDWASKNLEINSFYPVFFFFGLSLPDYLEERVISKAGA